MRFGIAALLLLLFTATTAFASTGVQFSGVGVGSSAAPPPGGWSEIFGTCSKATGDCFCDTIGTTGTINGPYSGVLVCEDADHNALWLTSPTDPGGYGNWVDTVAGCTGSHPNDRGCNSYWTKKYGNGDTGSGFTNGNPAAPTFGAACSLDVGFSMCTGYKEWRSDDAWNANSFQPWMDAIRDNEWDDENGSTTLAVPGGVGAQLFGNAAMGYRVPAGSTTGFQGAKSFGGTYAKVGITAAIGYESNVTTSGIYVGASAAWKHLEFSGTNDGNFNDGLFGFRQTNSPQDAFPIQGFIFMSGCSGRAKTIRKGQVFCDAGFIAFSATTADYNFTTDFALGDWHCHSAEYDFTTITASRFRQWLDGELLIDIDVDMTGTNYDGATDGIDGFAFNSYANKNISGSPTTVAVRRYQDNLVMRSGSPVLCEDVGFPAAYNQSGL